MNDKVVGGVHSSFWIISIIALLWNVGGSINYLMQTSLDFVAKMPETARAIIEGRPAWATGGFAIGVFGGALGCLLLLFRRSAAFHVFAVSLLGIIVTMIHTVNVASSKIDFSPFEIFMMILSPIFVAAVLIWYTKHAEAKGWIS